MHEYANRKLPANYKTEFMFWAPNKVQDKLKKEIDNLYEAQNIIVNDKYKDCLKELIEYAGKYSTEFDNPFIRTLQIAKWSKAI